MVSETGVAKHYKAEIESHFQVPMPEMLESVDETFCAIKVRTALELFAKCMILIHTLQAWELNWQGRALGNFAKTLLNALEIKGKHHADAVKGVRAVIQSFEWQEEEIIRQMCQIQDTQTLQDTNVYSDPNWTFWHQLKRFFAHYTRDADAPIHWDGEGLHFWVPPVLHPNVKRLLVISSDISEAHLRRAFPDETIEVFRTGPTPWVAGNQVFQIRTDTYSRETLLDYDSSWDVIATSQTGQRFLLGIRAEIQRDPNVKHAIIADSEVIEPLQDITTANENVCFLRAFQGMRKRDILFQAFQQAKIIWILGAPERPLGLMWRRAQILFGNHEKPLSYETQKGSNAYTDPRIQSVYEQRATSLLTEIFEAVKFNDKPPKKLVLLTGMWLPNITDRPETLLFDWEDLQVAGGLDKLAEVITIRQQFETEHENLTANASREEVERVLGCSSRQANRVLKKLRGGKPLRVPLRKQILDALTDGEMKTAEIVEAIDGYPTTIRNRIRELVDAGEIVKLKRAVYARKTE